MIKRDRQDCWDSRMTSYFIKYIPSFLLCYFLLNVFSSVSYAISDLWADELVFLNKKPPLLISLFRSTLVTKLYSSNILISWLESGTIQELKVLHRTSGLKSRQNVQLNDMSAVPLINCSLVVLLANWPPSGNAQLSFVVFERQVQLSWRKGPNSPF